MDNTNSSRFLISGIQYFHECDTAVKESQQTKIFESQGPVENSPNIFDMPEGSNFEDTDENPSGLTEEGLASLLESLTPYPESIHVHLAIEIAKQKNIFPNTDSPWSPNMNSLIRTGSGDDIQNMVEWREQMKKNILEINNDMDMSCEGSSQSMIGDIFQERDDAPSVQIMTNTEVNSAENTRIFASEPALPAISTAELKQDQYCAFDIVVWHLEETLSGREPPPL